MNYAVLVDFGSTYTKVACVDLKERRIVLTDKFPSTVHVDAEIGLDQCFQAAKDVIGEEAFQAALKLATSSAAGGLRMAVVGLTEALSIEAGRNASFSAGGKLMYCQAGKLSEDDVAKLETAGAEILLLCGGYESGNTKLLLHNARMLSESSLTIPVIFAGNSFVAQTVRMMFSSRGKECFLAENIIPDVGLLNIGPTAEIIRSLFMNRITNMKGVGKVKELMDGPIIPTPASVLRAGELLCRGTDTEPGIGSFMMADIGGATTDIYSYVENTNYLGAKFVGSPEPFAKRTVEGDMGMRESSVCLVKEAGAKGFAACCGITEEMLADAIERRISATAYLADDDLQRKIDHEIACHAVRISARRHAGHVVKEFRGGCRLVQRGKNLTGIKAVIGTGGIIVNEKDPRSILEQAAVTSAEKDTVLLPAETEFFIDQDYVFFAAGLLRDYDEDAALAIMKHSLKAI